MPCIADYETEIGGRDYTPLQACCRCGGGKFTKSVPPPPAPPAARLTTAAAMCTSLPGCCYDENRTSCPRAAKSSRRGAADWIWQNVRRSQPTPASSAFLCERLLTLRRRVCRQGEKVPKPDDMPDLSVGCCYSPHWEDTFADLDRETQAKPMWAGDIRKGLRAPRACPGPGYQEPEAQTLSWVWDESSSDLDDDAVLEGINHKHRPVPLHGNIARIY